MRRLENFFVELLPGFRCFGCVLKDSNPLAMGLQMYRNDETQEVRACFTPTENHSGFPGVLHGGLQVVLMDDVSFWALVSIYGSLAVTAHVDVKYHRPAFTAKPVDVVAFVKEKIGTKVIVDVKILQDNQVCSHGTFTFALQPTEKMEKLLNTTFSPDFTERLKAAAIPKANL
eukprot:TRINITY_DN16846_c0_g1_i1.p1 TRINITY_DN16846_c0_g1~~TRINITY_DN16846_c0_g1_i1.p1  ORF type:complete len:173 (-),score=33.31 TRINITY_DN16846_c0_g1_i1:37-555(-)